MGLSTFWECTHSRCFQLIRINPSGGEGLSPQNAYAKIQECFQLIRINPSGGVKFFTPQQLINECFQLIRINPSGGDGSVKTISMVISFQLIRINPSGGDGSYVLVAGTLMFPINPH